MLIIIILCILIAILLIYLKKSKILFLIAFLFAWIIMAFVYDIADETIYISRYSRPSLWIGQTEFLYALIIRIFHVFHFSFYQFKAAITLIQLLLVSSTIKRYAKYPAFVLMLYMIYPFALNVCQMRNALATAIIIFALRFILSDDVKATRKIGPFTINDLLYILFIIIATGIHTVSLFWGLLLIAKKLSLKSTIIFTFIFNMFFTFIFTPENLLKIFSLFGAINRMAVYLSSDYRKIYQSVYFHSAILRVSAYAIMIFAILIWLQMTEKKEKSPAINFAIKSNVIVLCIVSVMVQYTTEVYRIQEGMTVFNYIIISNSIKQSTKGYLATTPKNVLIHIALFAFSIINLWMLVLRDDSMVKTIIQPLFNNNFFFEVFKL